MNSKELENKIGYKFKNNRLLKESLTHRSYLNENPGWETDHNERLEFLGDAVLELAVTEELYNRFPDYDEGKMTAIRAALVNYQNLARIGKDINLEKYVLFSRGEAKDTGRARDVITANALEAVIGAIYLDSDYQQARVFVNKLIVTKLQDILRNGAYRDPKSMLQEKVQDQLKTTPNYRVLEEVGPEHKKIFKVGVYFNGDLIATGEGYSKQEAELEAARKALER